MVLIPGNARGSHNRAGIGGHSDPSNYISDPDLRSFLFVVNELIIRDDDGLYLGDDWYNLLPPTMPEGFAGEIPGIVMRYQNGSVAKALEYRWHRESPNEPGAVSYTAVSYAAVSYAVVYKQLAVFSCNPLLPIVVINGDPLSAVKPAQTPLLFFHPPLYPGRSHAVHPDSLMGHGPALRKYVAGANPSWMPSLVPTTYSNPFNAVPSDGLSGELPLVLGLMAFSESTAMDGQAVTRMFHGDNAHHGRWHDGQWHCNEAPRGYPLSTAENPRGFLITVCYDPENREYSNKDSLQQMEWDEVIVQESR